MSRQSLMAQRNNAELALVRNDLSAQERRISRIRLKVAELIEEAIFADREAREQAEEDAEYNDWLCGGDS